MLALHTELIFLCLCLIATTWRAQISKWKLGKEQVWGGKHRKKFKGFQRKCDLLGSSLNSKGQLIIPLLIHLQCPNLAVLPQWQMGVHFLEFSSNFAAVQLLQNTVPAPRHDALLFLSCFRYNLWSRDRTQRQEPLHLFLWDCACRSLLHCLQRQDSTGKGG